MSNKRVKLETFSANPNYSIKYFCKRSNNANLKYANLNYANLTDAKNLTNQQIKSAQNWEKAYFAKYWDADKKEWVVDEEKQEAKLKELKELRIQN